jgi:hypothetical protein
MDKVQIIYRRKLWRSPSSTVVQTTFNHGNSSSAGTFQWKCGRKRDSFPHMYVNCHERWSFVRNSPDWEPPTMFCSCSCCVPIAETINEVHISKFLVCVQWKRHCSQYTQYSYVSQLRTLVLGAENTRKYMWNHFYRAHAEQRLYCSGHWTRMCTMSWQQTAMQILRAAASGGRQSYCSRGESVRSKSVISKRQGDLKGGRSSW